MDCVYTLIQQRHPGPWDRLLDAGTGDSSLGWLSELPSQSWVAVTAESERAQGLARRYPPRPGDRIEVGNWDDPSFLEGERFDVVLADYLLGASDRFAPHAIDRLLDRLLAAAEGGWLYVIGREPGQALDPWLRAQTQLRDALLVLVGDRPHREVPRRWVEQEMSRRGYSCAWSETFETVLDRDYVERELFAMESNLERLSDRGLAQLFKRRCQELRRQAPELLEGEEDYLLAVSVGRPAATGRLPG